MLATIHLPILQFHVNTFFFFFTSHHLFVLPIVVSWSLVSTAEDRLTARWWPVTTQLVHKYEKDYQQRGSGQQLPIESADDTVRKRHMVTKMVNTSKKKCSIGLELNFFIQLCCWRLNNMFANMLAPLSTYWFYFHWVARHSKL